MAATETMYTKGMPETGTSFVARPDAFFSEQEICRLQELMQRVQDAEAPPEEVLMQEEYGELQALIKAELLASARRAAAPGF